MLGRIGLGLLCVWLPAMALAADASMGSVTLNLPLPAGYCELDPSQASDKRIIEAIRAAAPDNDILVIAADCKEITDWRAGKRLIEHMLQYQTARAARTSAFPVAGALSACNELRNQGEKINADQMSSIKENVKKAMSKVDFHGQTVLGVTGDDPNGCYTTLLQKFRSETGKEIVQLNMFFLGSIKDRLVYIYLMTPYESDRTIDGLLSRHKANTAALKAANGL